MKVQAANAKPGEMRIVESCRVGAPSYGFGHAIATERSADAGRARGRHGGRHLGSAGGWTFGVADVEGTRVELDLEDEVAAFAGSGAFGPDDAVVGGEDVLGDEETESGADLAAFPDGVR